MPCPFAKQPLPNSIFLQAYFSLLLHYIYAYLSNISTEYFSQVLDILGRFIFGSLDK